MTGIGNIAVTDQKSGIRDLQLKKYTVARVAEGAEEAGVQREKKTLLNIFPLVD